MNTRKEIIPNNLKEYRIKAGLTQKQVARKLGFSNEVSICHWEQGKNIPNLINLLKLSKLYNSNAESLYSELNQKLYNSSHLKYQESV
jgi:DNA-binding XRE family transcriptional regulator